MITLRRPEAFVEANDEDFDVLDEKKRIGRVYRPWGKDEWRWSLKAADATSKISGRAPSRFLAVRFLADTYKALAVAQAPADDSPDAPR